MFRVDLRMSDCDISGLLEIRHDLWAELWGGNAGYHLLATRMPHAYNRSRDYGNRLDHSEVIVPEQLIPA